MGDPKKQRKKFSKPDHPWRKERIEEETEIVKQYGLKRKYEVWKMKSTLSKYLNRAKTLIAQRSAQSQIETQQLLTRLHTLGLIKKDSRVEDILNLKLKDVLERRLQTLLLRKKLANSMLQARQLIVHEFIAVGARKVTSPSYLVPLNEEPMIKLAKAINLAQPVKEQKAEKKE